MTVNKSIEYLDAYKRVNGNYSYRHELIKKYAWAVPNQEALDTLALYQPILEIGAGLGYWAYLMQRRNIIVKPYDIKPVSYTNGESWTIVFKMRDDIFDDTENWTLFLCWPPYEEAMAYNMISKYKGKHVIYIGEGDGGCTADEKFHDYLYENFILTTTIQLPQWFGMHDIMEVWDRKIC